MDFALSDEQTTLQEVVRDFLQDQSDEAAVRAQMEEPAGLDRHLWKRMGAELGLQGLAIPEQYGGAGYTFVELGIVLEELGRALAVTPFFASSVMASSLLLALDDEAAAADLLPNLATGEVIGTVALAEDGGSWELSDLELVAEEVAGTWRLTGHKSFVCDGAVADVVLTVARVGAEFAVFAVDSNAEGLSRTPLPTLDQTRKLARLAFESTPGRMIGSQSSVPAAIGKMLDLSAIALAADSLGGTGRVLDMSVDYAKVREQFGRPIGSFQAIKHKCASMLVDLESSRSAVYYALWAAATDHEEVPLMAPLVKAHCVDVYVHAAGENIQIHGGIGFTWEHPAHLYLKRAKSSEVLLGGSDFHRQRLADRLGI